MKRRLLMVFSLMFTLIGILLIGIGCSQEKEFNPDEHEVVEEYYYDANGSEYLITLYSDDFFTLSIAGEEGKGKYALEGSALTLTLDNKGGEIVATISDNVLNLTYKEVAYNFRLKVEYTVQFDTKGGTTVADAKVLNGKTVAKPTEPTKDGEVFIGWYTDEAFRNLYEFSRPVTGNMKLYARFVTPIDPEFTVKFDAGEGASAVDPMTTKGGKLYDPELPTPTKSGAEFVGWYVSQFYTAEKLTYRYNEQPIAENITLYAVWDDGDPVVSVNETGVEVVGIGLGERYNITITAPDGTKPVDGVSSSSANYTYNFADAVKGEYMVEVTIGDKTTVRYYNNKALARVSVFEVEESTVLFNAVPNATKYLLSVTCGTEGHRHEDIDLGDKRSWSFENCDMPADGIKFVVKAEADGYVTSVSESFTYTRSLPAVTKVTVNSETETATWDAVSGATSYFVTVQKGTEELYAGNIGEATSFDLKYYPEGSYTVKVRPVARGWNSPADTACSYEKTRIATPRNLTYTGNGFTWEAVDGAEKYIVTIDGKDYESTTTTLSLEGIEFNGAKEAIEITVRAIKGSAVSLDSDVVTLRATLGNIRYASGTLSWDAVTGVTHYVVTVDGGEPIEVEGTSYNVTFTRAGNCTLAVSARLEGGALSVPKELTVVTYEIKFEMDRAGAAPLPSVYVAENDPIPYPDSPTFHGYTFEHWYTAPGGADGEGTVYDDVTFRDKQTRTLYAGWTANEHTLTFDVGQFGEELDVESVKVRFGESKTVDGEDLPVPTSKDQTRAFAGWYLDANHSTQLTDFRGQIVSGGFLQDADVKLYAYYVEVFKFEDDAQGGVSVSKGPGIVQGIVTEAKIPEQYGGKTVTRIIDFSDSVSLEVLHIPNTVTLIIMGSESNAFLGCTSLREIEVYAVEGNTNDVRYSSDNGVLIETYLGEKMIRYYPAAKSGDYTIPEGVTTIPLGAFTNVTGLTKLSVSYTVSQIEQGAFKNCTSLQEIEFLPTPSGTNATPLDIRDGAFKDCAAITKIHIPTRLTSITADTFSALTNLEEFITDDGGKYVAIDGLLCTNYEGGASTEYEVVFVPKGKDLGNYTIPNQIVSIGARAFYEHPKLTGITIPGYVRHIGKEAFGHITTLTAIEFKGLADDPDLVLDEKAFYAGYKTASGSDSGTNTLVTELHLPANLVKLGQYAFGKYTKITTVYVETDRPEGTEIDYADGAFENERSETSRTSTTYVTTAYIGAKVPAFNYSGVFGAKLATIQIDDQNPYVKEEDSVVYDNEMTSILFFPVDRQGDYVIPDSVTSIAANTFANRTGITAVTIPASVITVGEGAFRNCDLLKTVTFLAPQNGEGEPLTIESSAFYDCAILSEITLPDRLVHLGTSVFYNCDGLTSIKLPKNLQTIDQIANSSSMGGGYYLDLFYMCDNLSEITVDPENQYYTGIDGVLYAVREFKLDPNEAPQRVAYEAIFTSPGAPSVINVPGTVRIVRTYAFRNIYHTTKITFENLVPLYDPEDGTPDNTELTFQMYALYGYNSDTTYGSYNTSVKEIVLPQGIKTIGENLLYNWKGLTSITIPNTVTLIEEKAFYGCENLSAIDFEKGGTEPLVIGDGHNESAGGEGTSYYGVFLTYVSSYSTVTSYALPLDSIVLPARTTHIGDYAFYYSPVKSITFDGELEHELTIGAYAFGHCSELTSFTIPEGTKEIGASAFSYAVLPEIDLPDSLVTIGDQAFSSTHVINHRDTLTIPKNVESIGYSAFYDNSSYRNYKTVDLSAATKLTFIGYQAFAYMKTLTTVKFAKATEDSPALKIGAYAFANDPLLNNVVLPANVADIGSETVWGASGTFAGNKSTGQSFANNYALKSITFDIYESGTKAGKSDLALIADKTFTKTGLTSITFPESSADELVLGANLFTNCASLTSVYLSGSIQNIDGAFSGCGSLQTITVAEGSKFFSQSEDPNFPALYNAEGDSVMFVYKAVSGHIDILSGVKIGANAFANQTEITSVTIGASVQEIGSNAFANCISLQSVTFKEGSVLTSIGSYAFLNCYELSSINLDICTHLQTLGTDTEKGTEGYIFQNCNKLSIDLKINSSELKTVGTYAFGYCAIKSVDLSDCTVLTDLGNYAFAQNDALTSVKFPSSLEFLGTNTFANSDTIEEIDLSNTRVKHLSNTKSAVQSNTTALGIFNCDNLKTVRLPAGLLSIGTSAFNGATSLASIYIGTGEANDLSTVTTFYGGSLYGSGIASVKLSGASVFTEKGSYGTFQNCTNLKSVEFVSPENLTEIQKGMFKGCTNLDTLDFTKLTSLAKIGQDAFRGCGFTSVDLSKCKGGTSFMSATYTFAECANLNDVTLPKGVTKVGNYAFMGSGFTSVNLADFSMFTSWGNYMFQKCPNLTEVTIPAGVKLTASAGTNMFDGCESLGTVNIEEGYTGALPNNMFQNCIKLENVNFNGAKVSAFGTNVFKGCTNLRTIDLSSATATALGNYDFDGCESLTNVTLPNTITHLGTYTFRNCTSLTTIDLSNTKINRISNGASSNVTATVAVHTFEGCTNLAKVILPEGGIKQIGGQVFLNCTSLTEIENLDLSELTHIGKEAFRNCAYITGEVTLGENLEILGDYAFLECPGVTSFTGAENGKTFKTQNGMIIKVADDSIVAIPANMTVEGDTLKITGVTLAGYSLQDFHREGVTKLDLSGLTGESLPNYALTGTTFEEITLPDTMTTLGTNMFENSPNLKKVHLPESLTSLGSYAFKDCLALTEVHLPDSLTSLGNYAFKDCPALTEVHLPANLTSLGTYAFQNCVNLTTVNIPEGLTALPDRCFDGCTSFTGFVFPKTITTTGTYVFQNTALTEITIPETVTALGNYTFSGILTLKSAKFEGNPSVGTYLFSGCTALADFDLGPCTAISQHEFDGTAITDFTFNENLTTIGQYPFSNSKLKSVTINCSQDAFMYLVSTTMMATSYVFQDCTELTDVTINSELTKLGSSWFKNCVSLETITIPETVTEISAQCFQGCTKLREINLPENLTTLGNGVFTDCTALTGYFVLPDNIVSLGTNVFSGCTGLDGIELSTSVGNLQTTSFGGMQAGQTIRFRNSRFEVVASCGVAWIASTANLKVEYSYDPED